MTDLVLLERDGEIAKVTLNQPAKLNAINNQMWTRLREIFAELDGDASLRCVILAGSGERAFSVGADISEFEQNRSTIDQARRYHERTHAAMQAISCCRHPVIARIKGLCVGGGLELATTCDLRICGESARLGIPVKRLGLVVSYSELKPLVDLIGPANALEILLEGRIHSADEALRMGLVNRVVPDAEVERETFATAERIAEGAPLVARWHKKFTRRLMQPEPITEEEMDESFDCFETEDFQAGYRAFLAKSKPEFRGR
jgi:enoyl-CoA hydratase